MINQRTRYFIPAEGEGEQSFIKWIQQITDQNGLHVHLDCQPLGGGGYEALLKNAIRYRKLKERHKAKSTILLLDKDRADGGHDGWTITQLRETATKHKIDLCLQVPNLEGLFLRMFPGNERLQPDATNAKKLLRSIWPEYKKPTDAQSLAKKFTFTDLKRAAKYDEELTKLLETIGLA